MFVALVSKFANRGMFAKPYESFGHSIGCGGVGLCVSPQDLPLAAQGIEWMSDPCSASGLRVPSVSELRSVVTEQPVNFERKELKSPAQKVQSGFGGLVVVDS